MTNEELAIKLQEVDDRSKSNKHRIDKLEEQHALLDKLAIAVETQANEMIHVKSDLAEVKDGVKAILEKPAKRWDSVVTNIVLVVVAAVVTWLLARVGIQ